MTEVNLVLWLPSGRFADVRWGYQNPAPVSIEALSADPLLHIIHHDGQTRRRSLRLRRRARAAADQDADPPGDWRRFDDGDRFVPPESRRKGAKSWVKRSQHGGWTWGRGDDRGCVSVGAFGAQAASASAGDSPKFSFFGIGGNGDTRAPASRLSAPLVVPSPPPVVPFPPSSPRPAPIP